MDIYEHAKKYDADYMDSRGNIYKIQEYNRAIRNNLPTPGIRVFDWTGNFIGIAQKKSS